VPRIAPTAVWGDGDSGHVGAAESNQRSPPPPEGLGQELDEAEIEDLDEAVGRDHHVLGLEVAVDDARGVGLRQAVGDLGADVQEPAGGERAPPVGEQDRAQGLALDELHDDVVQPRGLLGIVDRHDVRVAQLRGGEGLLAEPAEARRVRGEPLGQELHGHVAVQVVIARSPDLAHPTRAQPGEELVAPEPHADGGGHGAWTSCRGTAAEDYAAPCRGVKDAFSGLSGRR
jgi:hypothetical protein